MVTLQDIPCYCITHPCNCGIKKTQEIEGDRVQVKPQKVGGSDTEKMVFAERISKAKRKARIRRLVFLGLVGGLIYLATRK